MDREDHTKWSKPKTMSYDIAYTWNQKENKQNPKQMNLLTKQKDLQILKTNLRLPKGNMAGRGWGEGELNQELGINVHTLLYIR